MTWQEGEKSVKEALLPSTEGKRKRKRKRKRKERGKKKGTREEEKGQERKKRFVRL